MHDNNKFLKMMVHDHQNRVLIFTCPSLSFPLRPLLAWGGWQRVMSFSKWAASTKFSGGKYGVFALPLWVFLCRSHRAKA